MIIYDFQKISIFPFLCFIVHTLCSAVIIDLIVLLCNRAQKAPARVYPNQSNFGNRANRDSFFLAPSVSKCTALAINIRLFGRWYGRMAQCKTLSKIYGFLVPLYGCTVKNTVFCFSASKTDFLKLSWLEVYIFFVIRNFGQRLRFW